MLVIGSVLRLATATLGNIREANQHDSCLNMSGDGLKFNVLHDSLGKMMLCQC